MIIFDDDHARRQSSRPRSRVIISRDESDPLRTNRDLPLLHNIKARVGPSFQCEIILDNASVNRVISNI